MSVEEDEYEDELVTSHSDEMPELGVKHRAGPLATYSAEGRPADDLYKGQDREPPESKYFHKVKNTDTVVYEEVYIPDPD